MKKLLALLALTLAFGPTAHAVGTVTVTRSTAPVNKLGHNSVTEIIQIDWVADSAAATVPNTSITLGGGWVTKVITNPGSTAPTANYDMALGDPEDSALDALAGAIQNRHTSTTEQVYPVGSSAQTPVWLEPGTYTFSLSNNAVNSATGRVLIYLIDSL